VTVGTVPTIEGTAGALFDGVVGGSTRCNVWVEEVLSASS
jgi:hypothetical protein